MLLSVLARTRIEAIPDFCVFARPESVAIATAAASAGIAGVGTRCSRAAKLVVKRNARIKAARKRVREE